MLKGVDETIRVAHHFLLVDLDKVDYFLKFLLLNEFKDREQRVLLGFLVVVGLQTASKFLCLDPLALSVRVSKLDFH